MTPIRCCTFRVSTNTINAAAAKMRSVRDPRDNIWSGSIHVGGLGGQLELLRLHSDCDAIGFTYLLTQGKRNHAVLRHTKPLVIKVKIKVWTLVIASVTWVRLATSSALQSRKWQLIGMSQWCRSTLCGYPLPALTDSWTYGTASRHTPSPQSIRHTRPSLRIPQ